MTDRSPPTLPGTPRGRRPYAVVVQVWLLHNPGITVLALRKASFSRGKRSDGKIGALYFVGANGSGEAVSRALSLKGGAYYGVTISVPSKT